MIRRIRRELHDVRHAEPGKRFEEGFERTRVRNHVGRIALIAIGVALMLAAAATFVLPGPNFILVLAGLVLVAGQSRTVARWLDRAELAARTWHRETWQPWPHKRALKVVGAVLGGLIGATIAWYAWQRGWIPGID
jgi:hypothetical protein